MGTEAVGLNLAAQTVALSSVEDGDYDLGFDHLMIATGASPVTPPIPGVDAPNVGVVHTIDGTRRCCSEPPRWPMATRRSRL